MFWDDNRTTALSNAAQDGEYSKAQLFLSATLAQTFNNLSSALTGAAITVLALAEPFIAAGAAAAFWSFSAAGKGLGPRGYERNEIINAWWVPPSTREISYFMKIRSLPLAKIICVFCLETKGTNAEAHFSAETTKTYKNTIKNTE
ncbi:hypothetical protein [Daejeonella sp.]|uniref:hypothetical protein n=1 Tax=Daejeonella sp. TaxID=2805397 RepID=UPI0037C0EB65